jgi:DedD protein
MAFFKFRKGGDDQATTVPQPESVEVMRKRAKHRLIGAVVLVLTGVIGFPLLVDKQPRPIAVDIPIEIPDKAKVKPLTVVPPAPQAQPAASAPCHARGTVGRRRGDRVKASRKPAKSRAKARRRLRQAGHKPEPSRTQKSAAMRAPRPRPCLRARSRPRKRPKSPPRRRRQRMSATLFKWAPLPT